MQENMQEEIKEPFCAACVTAPLALISAGGAAVSSGNKKKKDKQKKIIFWVSVGVSVLSIILTLYYIFWAKCEDCNR